MLSRGVAHANSSDYICSEGMTEEIVVLARDERQLGEEDAIVLNHRLEVLLSRDEILELRGAEDGEHGSSRDVHGLAGEARCDATRRSAMVESGRGTRRCLRS